MTVAASRTACLVDSASTLILRRDLGTEVRSGMEMFKLPSWMVPTGTLHPVALLQTSTTDLEGSCNVSIALWADPSDVKTVWTAPLSIGPQTWTLDMRPLFSAAENATHIGLTHTLSESGRVEFDAMLSKAILPR